MRYYNENPQITALKEAHENEIRLLKKTIQKVDMTYQKKLVEFNTFPWYKKAFFKFKV